MQRFKGGETEAAKNVSKFDNTMYSVLNTIKVCQATFDIWSVFFAFAKHQMVHDEFGGKFQAQLHI